ncbi:MAG TPA: SAM-dependent methyltransferase [Streptosporangiaceae bacterium]|nr:SAM-dependent methyltransferase [Streptosporangiaceae bacterium]
MQQDNFPDIDTKTASGARMYDYMLGGTDNYAVDRIAADQVEDMLPGTKAMARNNRRFMERVVRYLAGECGIRQFIDNGSGLPTQYNVHQIAQGIAPGSRVIYVDNDPVVLRHQKVNALAENDNTAFILADARNVDDILSHPETARLLNFNEPAAALYLSFLHFIPDEDDPWGMVRRMISRLAPGSFLVISHVVSDDVELRQTMTDLARSTTRGNYGRIRKKQEVRAFFDGLELVEPGLVSVATWRPDGLEEEQSQRWIVFGGVGRKPA